MKNNYNNFKIRIEKYIDKYYKNLLVKGIILFLIFALSIILIVSTLEYLSWFNYNGRLFLFLISLLTTLFIFNYFLTVPLLRFLGIFKRITNKRTAYLLKKELPELKDIVENIFELKKLEENSSFDNELLIAAINQKIEFTSKFNFIKIINSKNLIPLFKYLLTISFIYIVMLFFKPDVLIQGSNRVIHFNKNFEKSLGYSIIIDENFLTVEKGNDLVIDVNVSGNTAPENLSIFFGNSEFLLHKKDNYHYFSKIKNINSAFSFRIGNDNFKSKLYKISVINPPFLRNYKILADYPNYLNKENESFFNVSNLKVPVGTNLKFIFNCDYIDSLLFNNNNSTSYFNIDDGFYNHELKLINSIFYDIIGKNAFLDREIVPKSYLAVIPDLYPEIVIKTIIDKQNKKLYYFKGNISDDYGIHKLFFFVNNQKLLLPFNKNLVTQEFYFNYEFDNFLNDEINFYFEVFDNDEVNGYKSSRSKMYFFKIPDYKELSNLNEKQKKEITEKMEKSILLANELKRDIEKLKQTLISENLSKYDKKEMFDELTNKQQVLNELIKELTEQNLNKNNQFNSFSEQDKELLAKQKEIQEMMEKVMDDELKKLLEEIEKLSNEFNKQDFNQKMDELELNYDNLSEQLDKNLELLKKYEIERNLENISSELKDISDDQKKLATNELKKQQIDSVLNENISSLNNLKDEFNSIDSTNSSLQNPYELDNLENDFKKLNSDFENTKNENSLDTKNESKKNNDKSKFEKNSEESTKLAEKIDNMLNNNRAKENGENAETLRQILENLLYFSFDIEDLNGNLKNSSSNSPLFYDNIKKHQNLLTNYVIIKDSLIQLSKRTTQLGNHITKKVFDIEKNLIDAELYLVNRNTSKANIEQREGLGYTNDLILLLSESLKNMENSGSGSGSSKSRKNKPKKNEPSMSDMRKSQESIKSQLESMIKQMKEGKQGKGQINSEQLGKMLAQQEIFQQMINQMQNRNGVGNDFVKELEEINKNLGENRKDLIKNNISHQTLLRQENIITRLLKAEKAEIEREIDNKRKSNEANDYLISKTKNVFDDEKKNINFNEILIKDNIKLKSFYKTKYQEYLRYLE